TSGNIIVDGVNIADKKVKLSDIRKKVGLVFQYPEYQLFEETIEKDIEYGPRNLGISEEEISKRVKKSMEMVGLDYETYKDKSPFDLSGGQKRRVAIAGVIAM
ncbi:ATP-binding cassette domain-containing protein, partial [Clostridium perfringens]|uniref:ATP-binding cassette domain-containing protein n=2 Tax=Clostridium TaxID=1485 RepID=UPI003F42CFE2